MPIFIVVYLIVYSLIHFFFFGFFSRWRNANRGSPWYWTARAYLTIWWTSPNPEKRTKKRTCKPTASPKTGRKTLCHLRYSTVTFTVGLVSLPVASNSIWLLFEHGIELPVIGMSITKQRTVPFVLWYDHTECWYKCLVEWY